MANSLPLDVDIQVNIQKMESNITTDLSSVVFCTPNTSYEEGTIIKIFSSLEAVLEEFDASSESYKAAQGFFAQPKRATRLVIAAIKDPDQLAKSLQEIYQAGLDNSIRLYGWAFDKTLRDSEQIVECAKFVSTLPFGLCGITSNDEACLNKDNKNDIGSQIKELGLNRTFVMYHDNEYYYPEVAALALALSVDYYEADTAISMKFKNLYGIPTCRITEEELSALQEKQINSFVLIAESSRTFRDGVTSDENYYIDDIVNLDNLKLHIQAELFNLFTRVNKIPFSEKGLTLLYNALNTVGDRFVKNGCLDSRELSAEEAQVRRTSMAPAYEIVFPELSTIPQSQRQKRIGPPAQFIVNLSGAIHSLTVNVNAYA